MDLEIQRSVDDNELVPTKVLEKNGEVHAKANDNGNCAPEIADCNLSDDLKVEETLGKIDPIPGGSVESSPPTASKGRGLKKWRRIRRESGKETNSTLDANRKRGMPAAPVGTKLRSEGSSSSTNAISNVLGNNFDHSQLYGDLGHVPDFAARADSENSEDRNSRSSTAASAPRTNHELPAVGLGLDMNTMRSLKEMNSGKMAQSGDQQEKSRNVTKKARGFKLKKENSYSSMESDSRSSNFVFTQGANSMTSNGRQSGRSGNYDEDYSDDAQNGGSHLNVEDQTAFSKNEADSEEISPEDLAAENSWEVKEEKVDDHVGSGDRDALVECIMPLHLAQEALEKEIEKLRDVGKEEPLSSDDSVQPSGSSVLDEDSQSNKNTRKQNNINLQNKLEEAQVLLELKDAKISKLESPLNFKDIKTEHDELLKQRIAAELEYLVIIKTIENMKLALQEKNLAAQEVEEKLKLRKRVYRYTFCFMIQLVLFFVVVYLFVLQFWVQDIEVTTPT